jgi:pyruvate dehydrogenase E2 component (dihydrolipoamide acetyltransferase)
VDVLVPDLGDFSDVEVIEILVKPGDVVAEEGPLITLETEKAAFDVPSPRAGTIKEVRVSVGATVSTGDAIVVLEDSDADGRELATETASAADGVTGADAVKSVLAAGTARATEPSAGASARPSDQSPGAHQNQPRARVDEAGFSVAHASPSVRKLARELGVDLARVNGTGRKGRATSGDVKVFVKAIMQGGAAPGPAFPSVPTVDFAKYGPIDTQPLSRIQKISGPRLHASWVNVPHVTQHDEADITDLENTRQSLKATATDRGIKLTPLAFVVRACALTLAEYPNFRSSLSADGSSLVVKNYTHIGFAADTPNGLVVPVIRDADKKDIYELASALGDLSARAREGKLKADEMQGGVFTISSLGGIGGSYFTPIINAPEVAILGVSRNFMKPVYQDGSFVPRLTLPLSLSYDHRVIDGAQAARFITRLSAILSEAERLVAEIS